MADIAIALLDAYKARLTSATASGETLEGVGSFFVLYTAADTPPEYGSMLPIVIVSMLPISAETISIPGCMVQKTYPVRFTVFSENGGDTETKEAATILDLLETEFFQDNLSLSEWVDMTSKDYSQVTLPAFSGDWNGAGEMIITHTHVDIREV